MIFVTVGAQMPFDRLIRTVDQWAARAQRSDVFAQIGKSDYQPTHIQWTRFLESDAFREKFQQADTVIAHAGTGSILTAMELAKPILVMPRAAALNETRNDHQFATAERFSRLGAVAVALDETQLIDQLDHLDQLAAEHRIGPYASPALLQGLRDYFDTVAHRKYPRSHASASPSSSSADQQT